MKSPWRVRSERLAGTRGFYGSVRAGASGKSAVGLFRAGRAVDLDERRGLAYSCFSKAMEQHRLPFSITEVYAGFARVDGFLVLTDEHMLFEYQVADNMLGALRGKIRKSKIRYGSIEAVESRNGWFSSWIEFRAKTMRTFAKFPHKDRTTLRVAVEKKHRKALKAALSEIDLRRSYAAADRLLKKQKKRVKPTQG